MRAARGAVLALGALALAAGCRPARRAPAALPDRLVLAGVVDEAGRLGAASQVEGAALELLWARLEAAAGAAFPPADEAAIAGLLESPDAHRGEPIAFRGRLVAIEAAARSDVHPRLGPVVRGLVLLPDGGLAAFRGRPGVFPRGADGDLALPECGRAVEVAGLFMKRWVALDAQGLHYVAIPLVASGAPRELAGAEAAGLSGLQAAPGVLPVSDLDAPAVWSRPVVEMDSRGGLTLDGAAADLDELSARLRSLGLGTRDPLGAPALVPVAIVAPEAPEEACAALRAALGPQAVMRRPAAPPPPVE